jgi:hypothetical protein
LSSLPRATLCIWTDCCVVCIGGSVKQDRECDGVPVPRLLALDQLMSGGWRRSHHPTLDCYHGHTKRTLALDARSCQRWLALAHDVAAICMPLSQLWLCSCHHTHARWLTCLLGCSGDSPHTRSHTLTHALCPLASSHPLVVRAASARHEQQPLQEALRRLCPRRRLLSWVKPRRQRCSRRSTMRLTLCS